MKKFLRSLFKLPVLIMIGLLKAYQFFLSPLLGTNCRFTPSCSEYTIIALRTQGLIYGSWLAFRRIIRCHPYSEGGLDLVPEKKHGCGCHKR